jgi:hypothetical protein
MHPVADRGTAAKKLGILDRHVQHIGDGMPLNFTSKVSRL